MEFDLHLLHLCQLYAQHFVAESASWYNKMKKSKIPTCDLVWLGCVRVGLPNRIFQVLKLYWRSSVTCGINQGNWRRRFDPTLGAGGREVFSSNLMRFCHVITLKKDLIVFSVSFICTGARRDPTTCGTHQGDWKRRFYMKTELDSNRSGNEVYCTAFSLLVILKNL